MIDEYPILFVAAAFAEGRHPRPRPRRAPAQGIGPDRGDGGRPRRGRRRVEESATGLAVHGRGGAPLPGGVAVDPGLDHRVAMAFAVAGLRSVRPIGVADMAPVRTSFPGFLSVLDALGTP